MLDPIVRPAATGDDAQLADLERTARAGVEDRRGGARWLATHPAGAWRTAPTVLVASIDDVLVGYLVLGRNAGVASIEEVYVLPEARELGFGDALLAAAIDTARSAGAAVLEGEALPGDRDVKNLYERAGITARLIIVSPDL